MIVEIMVGKPEAWSAAECRRTIYAAASNEFAYETTKEFAFGASDADVKAAAIQAVKDALDYHNDPYSETDTFIVRGHLSE